MNAELKSKVNAYLKNSRATVGKELIKSLKDNYTYIENSYEKLSIDYNRLVKDNTTIKEELNNNLKELVELKKSYQIIKSQYNSNCDKLKQTKEEILKYQTETIELKKDIEGNKNQITVLKKIAAGYKEDNDDNEKSLKFYKIGFYSSLSIIILLGLLLVA